MGANRRGHLPVPPYSQRVTTAIYAVATTWRRDSNAICVTTATTVVSPCSENARIRTLIPRGLVAFRALLALLLLLLLLLLRPQLLPPGRKIAPGRLAGQP